MASLSERPRYEDPIPDEGRKRPGPKAVHIWSLLAERDHLVRMLENYWPQIEPFCIPRGNADALRKILEAIRKDAHGRHGLAAQHLLANLEEVIKFISGDRFRNDPRQIANAFAGFPQVGIWRSLKICQASPCPEPIGHRAIRAYIRRKHSTLFQDLAADHALINFVSAFKRYRSADPKLKMYNAATLYKLWKECTPKIDTLTRDRA